MRTQLPNILICVLLLMFCSAGCQTPPRVPAATGPGPVAVGGFVEEWQAPLELSQADGVKRLYLRDDTLYAYSASNGVFAISATGGEIRWTSHFGSVGDQLMPPLLLGNKSTILAGISDLKRIGPTGRVDQTVEIGHSVRSPLAGEGDAVYCALSYPTGTRFSRIDLSKPLNNIDWEFVVRAGMDAAPAIFQGSVFAGGVDGNVYAVNGSRDPVWPLPDGAFKTGGRIFADLRADMSGVYVACTDTKLYCLEPTSGKLKWQYFASAPLREAAEVTADMVYQVIPNEGVAAIDKEAGDFNRKARWIAPSAKQFLAEDAQYAYLRNVDNTIIGVDKKTGEPKFHSDRTDLVAFASNTKTSMIYASTAYGLVLGIRPVTKPGVVGQVVMIEGEEAVVSR